MIDDDLFAVGKGSNFLEQEDIIQNSLNQLGMEKIARVLSSYDTDGKPITLNGQTYTSKGKFPETYQTKWGPVTVHRHVYQHSSGGKTFCPMENDSRILDNATPAMVRLVAGQYSNQSLENVVDDLTENHQRPTNKNVVQRIFDSIGAEMENQYADWNYQPQKKIENETESEVASIGIFLDAAAIRMLEDGKGQWRMATCGAVVELDGEQNVIRKYYVAEEPEAGKGTLFDELDLLFKKIVDKNPLCPTFGISDGASDFATYLNNKNLDAVILDFYHVTEYLGNVKDSLRLSEDWMTNMCHTLKHNFYGAGYVLRELNDLAKGKMNETQRNILFDAIRYIQNNRWRMKYAYYIKQGFMIGSGVIEGACKNIIKARMCLPGAKWSYITAGKMLVIRAIKASYGVWKNIWDCIGSFGYKNASFATQSWSYKA